MYTSFEQFATASMLGKPDAPPRSNGELLFRESWEARAFGMAVALSKKGYFEWEEFRQGLIASIAEWEQTHFEGDPDWHYYQRWLLALERVVLESGLVSPEELEKQTRDNLAGRRR